MGKREIQEATGNEGIGEATAGWRIAVLVSCLTASACGGRALVGSLSCGDSDSGGRSSDASDAVACLPPPCSIIGDAWQLSGGEYMCTDGTCVQVVPPCTQGAIRFDPSGTLFRLTSAGWESACAFATCGDRVTGALLPSILTANYPAWCRMKPARACGPRLGPLRRRLVSRCRRLEKSRCRRLISELPPDPLPQRVLSLRGRIDEERRSAGAQTVVGRSGLQPLRAVTRLAGAPAGGPFSRR